MVIINWKINCFIDYLKWGKKLKLKLHYLKILMVMNSTFSRKESFIKYLYLKIN